MSLETKIKQVARTGLFCLATTLFPTSSMAEGPYRYGVEDNPVASIPVLSPSYSSALPYGSQKTTAGFLSRHQGSLIATILSGSFGLGGLAFDQAGDTSSRQLDYREATKDYNIRDALYITAIGGSVVAIGLFTWELLTNEEGSNHALQPSIHKENIKY